MAPSQHQGVAKPRPANTRPEHVYELMLIRRLRGLRSRDKIEVEVSSFTHRLFCLDLRYKEVKVKPWTPLVNTSGEHRTCSPHSTMC